MGEGPPPPELRVDVGVELVADQVPVDVLLRSLEEAVPDVADR
jgi:hypothetical protein